MRTVPPPLTERRSSSGPATARTTRSGPCVPDEVPPAGGRRRPPPLRPPHRRRPLPKGTVMSSSSSGISRRRLLSAAGITGAAAVAGVWRAGVAAATAGPSSYTATWASVNQHPPAAEWFQDAKFGIYFHWGAFSVPAFGNEWYPRNMYNNGSAENNHHKSVFGDPSVWPYHNFINGAADRAGNWVQFAPKLKSAGGNFDPNEWAQLFVDAG